MSKHDSKVQKLQADIIENRNPAVDAIEVRNKKLTADTIYGGKGIQDYAQMADVNGSSASILDWEQPGEGNLGYVLGSVVTHQINGVRYIFRSAINENTSIPALDSVDWVLLGLSADLSDYYTKEEIDEKIAVGVGSSGTSSTTDTGQLTIEIPHGLGVVPMYWNVRGENTAAKNVVNVSNESVDDVNIILTPDFMNNDGQVLDFLWEARAINANPGYIDAPGYDLNLI